MSVRAYKQLFAVFTLFLALASVTTAKRLQTSEARSDRAGIFRQPTRHGDFEQEYVFEFSAFGQRYRIESNGQGLRVAPNSGTTRFRLKLGKGFYVASLLFLEHQESVILLCGVSDSDAGGGAIYSLGRGDLRLEWMADIPGFNVGEALVEDNYAYITAIGFISKLDLRTGRYVWKQGDLFEKNHSFNNFDVPKITGNRVIFKGAGPYGHSPTTIEVDKRSGKILAMKD